MIANGWPLDEPNANGYGYIIVCNVDDNVVTVLTGIWDIHPINPVETTGVHPCG